MHRTIWMASLIAAWLGSTSVAQAQVVSYFYSTDQTTYSASPGQDVTVKIFLNEVLTGGAQSLILSGSPINGLLGGGFYVEQSSGSGNSITGVAGNTNPSNPGNINDGFTTNSSTDSNFSSTAARLLIGTNGTFGPTGTVTNLGGGQIYLGSVTVHTGADGSVTTYSLQTYANAPTGAFGGSGVNGNTIAYFGGGGLDLDVTNNGGGGPPNYIGAGDASSLSFTVVSTPEPGSIVLASLVAAGFGIGARMRRKRVTACPDVSVPTS